MSFPCMVPKLPFPRSNAATPGRVKHGLIFSTRVLYNKVPDKYLQQWPALNRFRNKFGFVPARGWKLIKSVITRAIAQAGSFLRKKIFFTIFQLNWTFHKSMTVFWKLQIRGFVGRRDVPSIQRCDYLKFKLSFVGLLPSPSEETLPSLTINLVNFPA